MVYTGCWRDVGVLV